MEYRDCEEQVKEQIRDFLPEKFSDAAIDVSQVLKDNDRALHVLTIRTGDVNISPAIYLDPFFEQAEHGKEMEDILVSIADAYLEHCVDHGIDVSNITDFEKIRDRITCRLVNEEANTQFLQDKPHTTVEDLAVVYQVILDMTTEGMATITISDSLLERYDVSLEELHELAMRNMDTLQPARFMGMKEVMTEMFAEEFAREQGMEIQEARDMAAQMVPDIPVNIYVLTNETKLNGAAVILNDDIRQEIAEKVGDFYILPSSIHETLIIPKSAELDLKDLEQMVREVNHTQVRPEERLSDHVYEYDAKGHELIRCDRAEERDRQKEGMMSGKMERPSLKDRLAEKKNVVAMPDVGRQEHAIDKKSEVVH